ncbi:hypothetical protein [Raineya orbicola]|jgi:ribosomal protein L37AE/L43A|nr:hypothetical protein [Raineya orbicola]
MLPLIKIMCFMCGIRFNHEKFAHQCYHCGKLALQEELFFFQKKGIWLCEECLEKEEQNNKGIIEKSSNLKE